MESSIRNIQEIIKQSAEVKQLLYADVNTVKEINTVIELLTDALKNDNKILLCGNGGSASDAQHIAAELTGRFYYDRDPLFAEALHVNTSYLTAVANDYSYDEVYSRMVKAKGRKGDALIAISTSGNSENIIRAINAADKQGMITIGLSGKNGGKMKTICTHCICVPSEITPRIQESHILIGHIICEMIEKNLFPLDKK